MSLSLDRVLWGLNPAGFHFTSIILHLAATVFLFLFLRGLLGNNSNSNIPAALAAALFSWHPQRIESVAWATERRDQLSLLFMVASAYYYQRAILRNPLKPKLDASLLAFVGALFSKVFSIILPCLFICLDLGFFKRPLRFIQLLKEKKSFIVVALITLILGLQAQLITGSAPTVAEFGWIDRLAVIAWTPGWTIWKTVLPVGLGPFVYVDWRAEPLRFWFTSGLTLIFTVGLVAVRHQRQLFWLGVAWFLALLPALGVFKSGAQSSADRYTLFPTLVLSVGMALLLSRTGGRGRWLALSVAIIFGFMSRAQARVWENSVTLWTRALETGKMSATVYMNLGQALFNAGRLDELQHLINRVGQEKFGSPPYLVLNAMARVAAEDFEGAEQLLKNAVSASPELFSYRMKYGFVLWRLKRYGLAAEQYNYVAQNAPHASIEKHEAWHLLAVMMFNQGHLNEAEWCLLQALSLEPTREDSLLLLGRLRSSRGN
jgi:tetratricopeptide (TPR) repeat protein